MSERVYHQSNIVGQKHSHNDQDTTDKPGKCVLCSLTVAVRVSVRVGVRVGVSIRVRVTVKSMFPKVMVTPIQGQGFGER